MANPYQVSPPPPPAPRRRSGNTVATFVVIALVIAGLYGVTQLLAGKGSDDPKPSAGSSSAATPSAKNTDPGNPESSSDTSSTWKVGDCGGPDPDNLPDGYRPQKCSASGATFKAIDIKDASMFPGSIQCPAGTDLMIEVSISYGKGKTSGIPTNTVCGRNLSGDHPGDAGAGGGQLVQGDCVTDRAQEVQCAKGALIYKVLALVKERSECPAGTDDPIELTIAVGRPYDVICGGRY